MGRRLNTGPKYTILVVPMKNEGLRKLIFIYNADSGVGNGLMDIAHKILRPNTYECSLCKLTHGVFNEHRLWKSFRKESTVEMEFLHKDEFERQYASKFGYKFTFPVILMAENDDFQLLVSTEELNGLKNLDALISLVKAHLSSVKS